MEEVNMPKEKEENIKLPEEFIKLGENFENAIEKLATDLMPLVQSIKNALEKHGIKIESDIHSSDRRTVRGLKTLK